MQVRTAHTAADVLVCAGQVIYYFITIDFLFIYLFINVMFAWCCLFEFYEDISNNAHIKKMTKFAFLSMIRMYNFALNNQPDLILLQSSCMIVCITSIIINIHRTDSSTATATRSNAVLWPAPYPHWPKKSAYLVCTATTYTILLLTYLLSCACSGAGRRSPRDRTHPCAQPVHTATGLCSRAVLDTVVVLGRPGHHVAHHSGPLLIDDHQASELQRHVDNATEFIASEVC